MASNAVMTIVKGELDAHWTYAPVVYPNTGGDAPGNLYLVVTYPISTERQASIGAPGANLFREEGGILFTLYVPAGRGILQHMAALDGLRTLFRARTIGDFVTWEAGPSVEDNENDEANVFSLSIAVPYRFNLRA